MINRLPPKITFNLLRFLDTQTLGRMASVSKIWKAFSETEKIWKERLIKVSHVDESRMSKHIYRDLKMLSTMSDYDLIRYAISDVGIVQRILKTPALVARIETSSLWLSEIAKSHPESAKLILQNKALADKFDEYRLLEIAKSHPKTAELVLQDQVLVAKLDQFSMTAIAITHPGNAKLILQTPALAAKIEKSRYCLCEIAKADSESAKLILLTPKFSKKIDKTSLLEITNTHPKAANYIFKNKLNNFLVKVRDKIKNKNYWSQQGYSFFPCFHKTPQAIKRLQNILSNIEDFSSINQKSVTDIVIAVIKILIDAKDRFSPTRKKITDECYAEFLKAGLTLLNMTETEFRQNYIEESFEARLSL